MYYNSSGFPGWSEADENPAAFLIYTQTPDSGEHLSLSLAFTL